MTPGSSGKIIELERFPSAIAGLDIVLGGGFFRSGVYIVQGLPGSGKTIFANQICFGHAASAGRALYVTLLAESHARMIQHLRSMSFFDEDAIPERVTYISAFNDLEANGLKGLMTVLRKEIRARRASLLVLDGLLTASESAETSRELKKFIHEVQTNATFHGCTVFLLTSGATTGISAERTMVDGIIELEDRLIDLRSQRSLQATKFRGSGSLRGKHLFEIGDYGLRIYPRIEALYGAAAPIPRIESGTSSGIASLDAMIGAGGFPRGSATAVVGSTGTGKTTLCLNFLSRCSKKEPGLYFGFFETAELLKASARSLGLDLDALEHKGVLAFAWHAQGEHAMDGLAHQLLEDVGRHGVKRLVIDGLAGFFEATPYPERVGRFFACLTNELRRRGVTIMMTLETRDVISTVVPTPYGVSALVDNVVFLRFVETNSVIRRVLSLIKVRNASFDHGIRELLIDFQGARIGHGLSAGGDIIPSAAPLGAAPAALRGKKPRK
jgi:circadian clock protein KaiC